MKLVVIFGPGAVGKMTVGQELAKRTGLRLFHNHMTIEPVLDLFGYFHAPAILAMRDLLIQEFVKTENVGMIFTMIWSFDSKGDWDLIDGYRRIFEEAGGEAYFVELEASHDERMRRNHTENRLLNKPSKRDLAASDERLKRMDEMFRQNSRPGEVPYPNYLRINNENMEPSEAARLIAERFGF